MSDTSTFPRRTVIVWVLLVSATCITYWLGTNHPLANISVRLATTTAILLAFLKVWFVGMYFMEVRDSPLTLKIAFGVWITMIGGGLVVLHAL